MEWEDKELIVSKGDLKLHVKIKNGTPALPNEVCLALLEEIERAKMTPMKTEKNDKDEFKIKSIYHMATAKERNQLVAKESS